MWAELLSAVAGKGKGQQGVQGGGGGEVGYSISPRAEASSGPNIFGGGSTMFGGINTGTQGLDLTTLALVGAAVVVALFLLRKK